MRFTLIFLLSLVYTSTTDAQVITYDDFKAIIPYLQKEDFKGAFEKSEQLLNSTQNDSSDLHGIVIYMNIFSAAGMVSLDQMTHEDFSRNANKFIGQRIVMSAHPCIDSSILGAFNSLQFVTKDGQLQGSVVSTNNSKTSIFCFEYFRYSGPITSSEFIGKNVRCGGILESIEVNPSKSKIWISRIHIDNAFARIMTPR